MKIKKENKPKKKKKKKSYKLWFFLENEKTKEKL